MYCFDQLYFHIALNQHYLSNLVFTAPPRNFINTTFLARSVTLDWDPPDQVVKTIGYNLTCIQSNGSQVSGLTATQSSTVTMFTIPVLVPFTEYTCRLSSINVVGEGPATQYTFKTTQDSKLLLYL